ncbi:MAG: PAS domain-containing protein [Dehalococcoidia bacterium]|nr:PAS domain-containing protein [Dehalococcoidia bacterium]
MRDATATPVGFAAIARDITEQIRARQELLETQAQLRSITENAPVLLMVWHAAGVCRFAAGKTWEAAGINPEELPGAHAHSHGAAAAFAHELVRLAQDHPPGATTRFQGRYYQSSHSPLGDDGSIVVVAVDVTDRVQAEAARHEAEERMRAVATNSPIASLPHSTATALSPSLKAQDWTRICSTMRRWSGRRLSNFAPAGGRARRGSGTSAAG